MENKLPFIYRTFFISIVSALSIFIIPIPITIFLLIKHYKLIKEQQILIEPILETYNSIELAKERLEKINADLDNQEELHTNILKEFTEEGENEKNSIIEKANQEALDILSSLEESTANLTMKKEELEKLNKEIAKCERIVKQNRSEAMAIKTLKERSSSIKLDTNSITEYIEELINNLNNNELLNSIINLHKNSDNSKQLRSLANGVKKEIKITLDEFSSRYTTKANQTIYNLIVLGLQSEIELIINNLKYGTLNEAKEQVNELIEKYLVIAGKGNQSILPTLTKFLLSIQGFYNELVEIEYKYYVKREREKEEQRLIREQMKQEAEERKALEAERKKIEREESKFTTELQRTNELLKSETDDAKLEQLKARIMELEQQMAELENQKESIATLSNGKAGYVYIISNKGSFGDDVFKIGMTRRLEPQDRIDELGSASVPFKFDVHAFIFSDDAVGLEYTLHQRLTNNRVNKVNYRKEFFRIPINDIEELVEELDPTADFTKTMLALEYNQTLALEQQAS